MSSLKSYRSWNGEQKIFARKETIIEIYDQLFECKKIPTDRQYWSMCGDLSGENGVINPHNEYEQVQSSGLFLPEQFVGVDNDIGKIDRNKSLYPNLKFYYNDFLKQIRESYDSDDFKPAIVNVDMTYMVNRATRYCAEILWFIFDKEIKNVMVIANMMLNSPYRGSGDKFEHPYDHFYNMLMQEKRWKTCHYWYRHWGAFQYSGNSHDGRTHMCSHIFYNKGEDT